MIDEESRFAALLHRQKSCVAFSGADWTLIARLADELATNDGSNPESSGTRHEKRRSFMRLISALWTAVFVFSFAPAFAEGTKTQGTPITSENVVDVLEIQRVVSVLSDGVDSQQWGVIRDILVDKVDTTIGETEPGVSRVKSEDEIVSRWKGFYDSAKKLVIHHVTSNERVFFDDSNNATVFSKGVIVVENTPAGEHASSGGTLRMYRWVNYEFGLTRTDNGWKVNKVLVDYPAQEVTSLKG